MNMRLNLPSLATLFTFLGLAISILFLQESIRHQKNTHYLTPPSGLTEVTSVAPIALDRSVEIVDIYPLTTRPLFSPSRRVPDTVTSTPVELETPAPPPINQEPQPETTPPPALVMIGILLEGPNPKALIRDANGTEIWLQNGSIIEGWRVVRIAPHSITLQLDDESVDIYSID